ncbi:PqqD family peptide modification chaperone [Myxococcota bacterium]|nr:PqqD family peptide modification chaperone [Myxococcota bacterium]
MKQLTIDAAARLVPHPDVVTEVAGDELLLVQLGRGSTFRLNRTGRQVWDAAIAGESLAELSERLAPALNVAPERLLADALALARALVDGGLAELRGPR